MRYFVLHSEMVEIEEYYLYNKFIWTGKKLDWVFKSDE